jgi:cytoskeleton protein RodZ
MNDPAAVEPQVAPSGPPGQAAPAGFGYPLAQARVRAGLSVEQAAARIRLHPKQLRAIEDEDLQALPAPAYVNGFVRNYARELGLDPAPLIEALNAKLQLRGLTARAPDLGTGGPMPSPMLDERAWRHLVLAGIVLALVCALLIGVWMAHSASRDRDSAAQPGRAPTSSRTPEAPAAMTGAGGSAPGAVTAPASDSAGTAPPAPVGAPPTSAAGSGATGAAGAAPDSAAGSVAWAAAAGPASAEAAASPASAGTQTDAANRGAAAASSRIPVATLTPAAGASGGLVLRFSDRSWVEVSQPDGRVLLARNGEPGSMELVNSSAPLVLVVGRADAVQVEYRGQPVNLKPYVNLKGVARVVLADGRVNNGGQGNR